MTPPGPLAFVTRSGPTAWRNGAVADRPYDRPVTTNPARALADVLQINVSEGESPVTARDGSDDGDIEFWRRQGDLLRLLRQIDTAIEGMRAGGHDMSSVESYVPAWYRAVFSFDNPWAEAQSFVRKTIAADPLNALRTTAILLDSGAAPQLIPLAQVRSADELLGELFDLLERDREAFPELEVRYAYTLLADVRDLFTQRRVVGSVDLQSKVDQLIGVIARLSAELQGVDGNDERASDWRSKLARAFGIGTQGAQFVNASADALSNVANTLGEITSGS